MSAETMEKFRCWSAEKVAGTVFSDIGALASDADADYNTGRNAEYDAGNNARHHRSSHACEHRACAGRVTCKGGSSCEEDYER